MQLALLYHKVFGHLEKFFAARIFSKIGVTVVVLTRQGSTHAVLMPCKRTTTITAVLAEKRTWVPGGGFRGGPIQQRKHKGKLKDTEGTDAFRRSCAVRAAPYNNEKHYVFALPGRARLTKQRKEQMQIVLCFCSEDY